MISHAERIAELRARINEHVANLALAVERHAQVAVAQADDALTAALDALCALVSEGGAVRSEPVAWQIKPVSAIWPFITASSTDATFYAERGDTVTPLYASPLSAPSDSADTARLDWLLSVASFSITDNDPRVLKLIAALESGKGGRAAIDAARLASAPPSGGEER